MEDQGKIRVVVVGDEPASVDIRKLLAKHGIVVLTDEVRSSDMCADRNFSLPIIDDRDHLLAPNNISPSYRANFKTGKKLRY